MEAVYQWIQQIAVFAVVSFLVLYVMGSREKKFTLHFYLSLLMILLILRPAAGFLKWDAVLAGKLTELETDTEIAAISNQIQEMGEWQEQEIIDYTSQKAISWIKGLVQDQNLDFLEGEVSFDRQALRKTQEVVITGMEITVSQPGKTLTEIKPVLDGLKEEMAEMFQLKESSVTINFR